MNATAEAKIICAGHTIDFMNKVDQLFELCLTCKAPERETKMPRDYISYHEMLARAVDVLNGQTLDVPAVEDRDTFFAHSCNQHDDHADSLTFCSQCQQLFHVDPDKFVTPIATVRQVTETPSLMTQAKTFLQNQRMKRKNGSRPVLGPAGMAGGGGSATYGKL